VSSGAHGTAKAGHPMAGLGHLLDSFYLRFDALAFVLI
jgi:hypothetical protein